MRLLGDLYKECHCWTAIQPCHAQWLPCTGELAEIQQQLQVDHLAVDVAALHGCSALLMVCMDSLLHQWLPCPGDLAEIQQQLQEARQPQLSVVPPGGSVQAPAGSQYKLLIHSPFQDWPARYGPVTGIPSAAYQVGRHADMHACDLGAQLSLLAHRGGQMIRQLNAVCPPPSKPIAMSDWVLRSMHACV